MRLPALCHLLLNLLVALSHGLKHLRTPAWDSRPDAATQLPSCLLIPSHEKHFKKAKMLLQGIDLYALDKVPVFLMLSSPAEGAAWQSFAQQVRGAPMANHTVLNLEEALTAEGVAVGNVSVLLERIGSSEKHDCVLGTGMGKGIGGVKKLMGARHLGNAHGCEVVWAMDCDSMPMRQFSFEEAFSRLGKVWVSDTALERVSLWTGRPVAALSANKRMSGPCMDTAQKVLNMSFTWRTMRLGLRQNDFWLFETQLLRELIPNPQEFLERWIASGQVSEQIVWSAWLAQGIMMKTLPKTAVNYTIRTVAAGAERLASCFGSSWKVASDDLMGEAIHCPDFDWQGFGRFWYEDLGQAGVYGDYLHAYQPAPALLKKFAEAVPWCVSNCQGNRVQQLMLTD